MAEILKLKTPIKIGTEKGAAEVTEVTYDANEIDGVLFATAEAKHKAAAGMKNITITPAAEFDFGLHLYLGFAAIIAVNPSFDFSDVERIKGTDLKKVMDIGRNFILGSGEEQPQKGSAEPTGITPEFTTQAPQSSNEGE